jgi:DNA repair protein RecO (recombination protein O)
MPLISDPCICLRKVEYSETSQILWLLTREHGLQRLIAKGAHRRTKAGASRFDGGIDLLDRGHAVFTHDPQRDLGTLCEWKLIEGNLDLRKNLRRLYLALYAAELVCNVIEENDPQPDMYDALAASLPELAGPRCEETFLALELRVLRHAGYLPELTACVNCGAAVGGAQEDYFSPARGGVVCRNCHASFPDRIALDARLLRLAQAMARASTRLPILSRAQTDPINRILAEHIQHAVGRRLRMARYVVEEAGDKRPIAARRN